VWSLQSRTRGGEETQHCVATAEVRGRLWTYRSVDRSWSSAWTLTLGAGTSPRRFEARHREVTANALRGVYKLEGETLTVCYARGDDEPPAGFDGGRPEFTLEVFKRAKK
jgi:uncharacterized protein (TIGR03067 family)